ncbi:M48 family metalloprotease [Pseudovibrio sp. Tun.PSC04-5.I4]|uniref:M48 family metalloprotease n=1 Tax=Pseudovibrio sp. Tun.PSC04-5.I4 TaxID=1798213 RepID=UPI00088BDD72|nr:M48 family metalloprotease [Pseudovibrio sp. Tun.PSC04-5.I4]SDR45060.1 Zn-dependent protease with chaperone function [Pseudovibrio sp. Tun.PSC04-5.I4]
MRNIFRHIAIDLSWFISWAVIFAPAFFILFYAMIPVTSVINNYALLPFAVPHVNELFVLCVQITLILILFLIPGVSEFFSDIRLGARCASQRELDQIEAAFAYLQHSADAKNIKLPRIVWRVVDDKGYNATAYGRNRIAIHRGALYDTKFRKRGLEELAGLIAHEIAHLRYWDTKHAIISSAIFTPFNVLLFFANLFIRVPILNLAVMFFFYPCSLIIGLGNRIPDLTSRMAEYRADEFSQKLLGKDCMCQVFGSIGDEREGTNIMAHYMASHPPTELRHNNLQLRSDYRPQFNGPPSIDLIARFRKH